MVERSAPRFWFEGRSYATRPGETVLDRLARDGLPNLQRSPRYHRPRAPFCGIGQCTGCLVGVNGRPTVRACRYVPADGDRVVAEHGWPSRRWDLFGGIDLLFRQGIDTLHGFRRPAFLTPVYQRVVRRLTGYGKPPSAESAAGLAAAPLVRDVDIAIVGAGRSGHSAAVALVAAGHHPLLLDRRADAPPVPGAELLASTTATFLPARPGTTETPFELIGYTEPARGVLVRARRVVVATGSYDASLLFESNDCPGVLTGDGALALARSSGRPPFHRAVLFGASERARALVEKFGEHLSAVVAPATSHPTSFEPRPRPVSCSTPARWSWPPRGVLAFALSRSVRGATRPPRRSRATGWSSRTGGFRTASCSFRPGRV